MERAARWRGYFSLLGESSAMALQHGPGDGEVAAHAGHGMLRAVADAARTPYNLFMVCVG